MELVDIIMEYLLNHHIYSAAFRNLLVEYLHDETDHFIHEFCTFMKSPFDMIGYDRHVVYCDRPQTPAINILSDYENDSDVAVVNSNTPPPPFRVNNNPFHRPIIEVIQIDSDTSRDSDVIIREPTPPVVVDLLDSDSEDNSAPVVQEPESSSEHEETAALEEENRKPILPLKIRLKHKRQSRENSSKSRKRHRHSSTSSSSTSESSSTTSTDEDKLYKRYKRRRLPKKTSVHKAGRHEYRSKSSSSSSDTSDIEYHIPLSKLKQEKARKSKKSHREKRNSSSRHNRDSPNTSRFTLTPPLSPKKRNFFEFELVSNNGSKTKTVSLNFNNERSDSNSYGGQSSFYNDSTSNSPSVCSKVVKKEVKDVKTDYDNYSAGPSGSGRVRSVIIKKESNSNLWYSRPRYCDSSDNDSF